MIAIKDLIAMKKKELKLTNEDIASASGLHLSTINYLTSGKTANPTLDTLQAIAPCLGLDLGDFNPDGIEFERPPMLVDSAGSMSRFLGLSPDAMEVAWEYSLQDERGKSLVRLILSAEARRKSGVHLLDFPPAHSATTSTNLELIVYDELAVDRSEDGELYCVKQFHKDQLPPLANFGVVVHGDSMSPQIPDSCIAFVQATPALGNGEIGMFMLDGKYYCAQLQMDERGVRLHPINPAFPDVAVLPYTEFKTIGRVLGCFNEGQTTML